MISNCFIYMIRCEKAEGILFETYSDSLLQTSGVEDYLK